MQRVQVALAGAQSVDALLEIATIPPWTLHLDAFGRAYDTQAADLFESLVALRRALKEDGLRICCLGALPDVYPSGMSRQMSGGRKAYRHVPGGTSIELVDIFEPAPCDAVVDVETQLARHGS
jgi:hypothetical protein